MSPKNHFVKENSNYKIIDIAIESPTLIYTRKEITKLILL